MGSFSYLDLSKSEIKKSVISKLRKMGYEVSDDLPIRKIQEIIMVIQRDGGLMIDGCIGMRTMPLLGYSYDEIRKMLRISNHKIDSHSYFPFLLLF